MRHFIIQITIFFRVKKDISYIIFQNSYMPEATYELQPEVVNAPYTLSSDVEEFRLQTFKDTERK